MLRISHPMRDEAAQRMGHPDCWWALRLFIPLMLCMNGAPGLLGDAEEGTRIAGGRGAGGVSCWCGCSPYRWDL